MGEPDSETDAGGTKRPGLARDVLSRLASGAALAVVAVGLLYIGTLPFALLVGIAAVLVSWEWSRLVRGAAFDAAFFVHAISAVLAAGLGGLGLAALGIAVVIAGAILVGLLSFGARAALSALGVIYTGLPAVSILWLRDDLPYGMEAVLLLLLAVVATDIVAFFAGRLIGGPKLAPEISPNKTWAGLIGGVTAAGIVGAAFASQVGADPVFLGFVGALLGCIAQAGDLFESGLKRHFGAKDASALIPGHGGVMDRIDGLIFAAVAAGLMALAVNPYSPARALFFGG